MKENYHIEPISRTNINHVNLPNQPFMITGKLIPKFDGEQWLLSESLLENPFEYKFPNDAIDYAEYIDSDEKALFFLYKEKDCAGQIRIRSNWNGFCFIEDIAIGIEHRRKSLSKLLLKAAELWAREKQLKGFMLEAQDFNLGACHMYHKYGFILGGVDNMLYYNSNNRDDLALFWYKIF